MGRFDRKVLTQVEIWVGQKPITSSFIAAIVSAGVAFAFLEILTAIFPNQTTQLLPPILDIASGDTIDTMVSLLWAFEICTKYYGTVPLPYRFKACRQFFALLWPNKKLKPGDQPKHDFQELDYAAQHPEDVAETNAIYPIEAATDLTATAKSQLHYREENLIRWYVLAIVFISKCFGYPLFIFGGAFNWQIAVSTGEQCFYNYFQLALMMHTTTTTEKLVQESVNFVRTLDEITAERIHY